MKDKSTVSLKIVFSCVFFSIIFVEIFCGCGDQENLPYSSSLQEITNIGSENIIGLNLTYQTPYPSIDVQSRSEIEEILTPIMSIPVRKSENQPDRWTVGGWQLLIVVQNKDNSSIKLNFSKNLIEITSIGTDGEQIGKKVRYDVSPTFDSDAFIENVVQKYRLQWLTLNSLIDQFEISSISISHGENAQTQLEDPEQILQILDFLLRITMEDFYTEISMDSKEPEEMNISFLITYFDGNTLQVTVNLENQQLYISGWTGQDNIKDKWQVYPLVYYSEIERIEQQERLNHILSMEPVS